MAARTRGCALEGPGPRRRRGIGPVVVIRAMLSRRQPPGAIASSVKRWAFILLGLCVAAAIAWRLASSPSAAPDGATPPHAEIDDASRRALQQVLEEVDRRESEPAPESRAAAPSGPGSEPR